MPKVDLKIDGNPSKVDESFIISAGKDVPASTPSDILIAAKLADDKKDICGFGQPITPALVNQIAGSYFLKSENAWELLEDIGKGNIKSIGQLVADSRFGDLKDILDPQKQIVSGVFGKEIILNIIGRKGCEGIRYIIGEMEDKMTIVLLGVKDVTTAKDIKPKSEPLAGANHYKNAKGKIGFFDTQIPPDTEVHGQSLTRQEVKDQLGIGIKDLDGDSVTNFLLGVH